MLSSMRNTKRNKPLIIILLTLLILGLVGFVNGGINTTPSTSIGTVGDEDIEISSYSSVVNNYIQRLSHALGRVPTPEEIQSYRIPEIALQSTIFAVALNAETAHLGLSIGDNHVKEEIFKQPSFATLEGGFDRTAYEIYLQRTNQTAGEYENDLRKSMASNLIRSALSDSIFSPKPSARILLSYAGETRDFEWAVVDKSWLPALARNPSESDLLEEYENNTDIYTTKELRKISYVVLHPSDLNDQIEISEDDIKIAYDEQASRFNIPERRLLDRLIMSDDTAAQKARADIDASEITFDQLIQKQGLTVDDVDMGEVEKGTLNKEADTAIFETNDLGVYGPFETNLGPAFYRVNAIIDEEITTIDDAKEILRNELAQDATSLLIGEISAQIEDLLAAGSSLEEIAAETDMRFETIEMTDDTTTAIAAYDKFRTAAQDSKLSDFPELLILSDDTIAALRLDEVVEPFLQPFEDVKELVRANLIEKANLSALQNQADILISQIKAGSKFSSLQLSEKHEKGIIRNDFVDGIAPTLMQSLFNANKGDVLSAAQGDQIVIVKLSAINPFDFNDQQNQEIIERTEDSLRTQFNNDLFTAYSKALQEREGVRINPSILGDVNNQIFGTSVN